MYQSSNVDASIGWILWISPEVWGVIKISQNRPNWPQNREAFTKTPAGCTQNHKNKAKNSLLSTVPQWLVGQKQFLKMTSVCYNHFPVERAKAALPSSVPVFLQPPLCPPAVLPLICGFHVMFWTILRTNQEHTLWAGSGHNWMRVKKKKQDNCCC